ncbi:MAG: TrmH family RNA methyltransferase [Treponemataceae bacterium]
MIPPGKLAQLNNGQRRRKLALCFGALERDIAGIAEKGSEYRFPSMSRIEYTKKLAQILLTDPDLPQKAQNEIKFLLNEPLFDERRLCNIARNHLLALIGTFPAEWDLIIAPHKCPQKNNTDVQSDSFVEKRNFYPGLFLYAEDIRSPFNIGSIFRTAEAMGAEKIFISPDCVDPNHPRAIRSGMGCVQTIPWERLSIEELTVSAKEKKLPIFALETGGTLINDFSFPKQGIVIIGSEELGISPQALKAATYGRVTIDMKGIKASLNVGVAFGILMQKWIETIA